MRLERNSMISFSAKYINSVSVQKIDTKTGTRTPVKVSCVELNPKDDRDLRAVREVVCDWETSDGYDGAIFAYMRNCAGDLKKWETKAYSSDFLNRMRFYAITSQKKDFNNLESGDILALSQVIEDDKIELKYLQVKPQGFSSFLSHQKIKYLGTKMLELITSLFPEKDITLCSNPHAYDFYLKNGFEMHGKGGHFIKRKNTEI